MLTNSIDKDSFRWNEGKRFGRVAPEITITESGDLNGSDQNQLIQQQLIYARKSVGVNKIRSIGAGHGAIVQHFPWACFEITGFGQPGA